MSGFPYNLVDELHATFTPVSGFHAVLRRPLRPEDPNQSIGIFALDWRPKDKVIGQHDPILTEYDLAVQCLVKHTNEEEGRELHAALTKIIRLMVYRDDDLRLRFRQLTEHTQGVTERVGHWGLRRQQYLSNEIDQKHFFVSTSELWVETEQA